MSLKEKDLNIHEQSWAKLIFKHGKWYIISSFFNKGISFIFLPITTRYLTPTDYGLLSSLNSIAAFLSIFISLYLDSAFGLFFHEYKKDYEKLRRLYSTIFWFVLCYGIIIICLVLTSAPFWFSSLLKADILPYAFLAFIPPLFNQLGILGIIFLNQSLKVKETAIVSSAAYIINMALTIILLVGYKLGAIACLIGSAVSALIIFSIYTIYFIKKGLLVLKFDKKTLFECLAYSVPLIPNVAGGWVAGLSDRLVIAKYIDLKAAGLYSMAYQFAMLLYMVQDAITQIQGTVSISGLIYDKEKTKEKIAKFSLYLWAFMLFAHLGLFLFCQDVIYIFLDHKYYEAYKMVGIIGFIYVLSSQYRIFSSIISLHRKTILISVAGIISAFVNLGLNIIFVPKYGYFAAAVATVVSMASYSLWIFLWAQHLDRINLNYNKILILFFVQISAILISYFYLFDKVSIINFSMKSLLVIIVGLIFYFVIYDSKAIKQKIYMRWMKILK